jgi:hypothetical protein
MHGARPFDPELTVDLLYFFNFKKCWKKTESPLARVGHELEKYRACCGWGSTTLAVCAINNWSRYHSNIFSISALK